MLCFVYARVVVVCSLCAQKSTDVVFRRDKTRKGRPSSGCVSSSDSALEHESVCEFFCVFHLPFFSSSLRDVFLFFLFLRQTHRRGYYSYWTKPLLLLLLLVLRKENNIMVEEDQEDPPPYASLIAISDDAKSILHVDNRRNSLKNSA